MLSASNRGERVSDMSPEGERTLARYAKRGWFNAAGDSRLRDDTSRSVPPRPAYLVFATGMQVSPLCEAQITTRCCYRAFRGTRLVVASTETRRFDLIDLKVLHRSQFRRGESLPLRTCVEESAPELIQWPLDVCGMSAEIVVCARIPAPKEEENDLGAAFDMILLGEVI